MKVTCSYLNLGGQGSSTWQGGCKTVKDSKLGDIAKRSRRQSAKLLFRVQVLISPLRGCTGIDGDMKIIISLER